MAARCSPATFTATMSRWTNSPSFGLTAMAIAMGGAIRRTTPARFSRNRPTSVSAASISSSAGRSCASRRCPASVGATVRVVRPPFITLFGFSRLLKKPRAPYPGSMEIKRSGSQPSGKGPAEYFTGTVRIDPLFQAPEPARALGVSVTFEPGARTAWHVHPPGQTLIVTAGCGLVQSWGGPLEQIRPGDVIWCPPGEKHWHGATATAAMTHIAIVEQLDGKTVEWMEKVSGEEYAAASRLQS